MKITLLAWPRALNGRVQSTEGIIRKVRRTASAQRKKNPAPVAGTSGVSSSSLMVKQSRLIAWRPVLNQYIRKIKAKSD